LYFEPAEEEYRIGEKFILEIRVDTAGECINAVEVSFNYPTDKLTAVEFVESRSILTLWPKPAEIDEDDGRVTFSGGLPGGFCPEDDESALLGELIMEVDEINRESEERIRFWRTSKILLNDGYATPMDYSRRSAYLTLIPEEVEDPVDPMQERIEEDTRPPKIFDLILRRTPFLFNGKYFIIFSAEDKESGIDYFEISEQRRVGFVGAEAKRWTRWERAESPYVLEDQDLRSIIRVRAVDKAGNETIKKINPPVNRWDILPWMAAFILIGAAAWRVKEVKKFNAQQ